MSEPNNNELIVLQERIAFLENTVDTLNDELATLARDMEVAKSAMQHIYSKMERLNNERPDTNTPEPPPPHY